MRGLGTLPKASNAESPATATCPEILTAWPQLRALHARSLLCWLATRDEDQGANVSPKEIFAFTLPGTLLIGEIASTRSLRNIARDPRVCVSMIDLQRQRGGFKVLGKAEIISAAHPSYADMMAQVLPYAGELNVIRNVIAVSVTKVIAIKAPAHLQSR